MRAAKENVRTGELGLCVFQENKKPQNSTRFFPGQVHNVHIDGEALMTDSHYYRLYRFDASGHVIAFKELDCRTDHQAIEQARRFANSEPQELWSHEKLLAVIQSQTVA